MDILPALQSSGAALNGLTDLIPIGGVGALIAFCLKIAIGQADKRATVETSRVDICSGALATCIAGSTELAAEVRKNNQDGTQHIDSGFRRIDDGLRRLEPIEESLAEILDHVRRAH